MGFGRGASQNRGLAQQGSYKPRRGEGYIVMTENEFQTVFDQGYQEGWGAGLGYGILLGLSVAGLTGLFVMFFLK